MYRQQNLYIMTRLLQILCFSIAFYFCHAGSFPEFTSVNCTKPDYFLCNNKRCISTLFVCDAHNDCGDNSDETLCDHETRQNCNSPITFQCNDGGCIHINQFCDTKEDCIDGSDEPVECELREGCPDARCDSGHCISHKQICDGIFDCPDKSDENSCEEKEAQMAPLSKCTAANDRYLCADRKKCIVLFHVCDEISDCDDSSDENEMKCRNSFIGCATQKLKCSKSQRCRHTPRGPVCACEVGYEAINGTCQDINECEQFGACDQQCQNWNGSHSCSCKLGFKLENDGRTCKVEDGDPILVFATVSEVRAYYMKSKIYKSIVRYMHRITGVAIDNDNIYWSDGITYGGVIMRSNRHNFSDIVVSSGVSFPSSVQVDWVTGNLYFIDAMYKRIVVCNNNGTHCTVIRNEAIKWPKKLVLAPHRRIMFWSDVDENVAIKMCGMDGSNSAILVEKDLEWPSSLAIDFETDRLYWVDTKKKNVECIRFDGTDRRIILLNVKADPDSISVFEDKLYFSDWFTRSIHSVNKYTGRNYKTLFSLESHIYNLQVYHPIRHQTLSNPCSKHNCSEICLLSQGQNYSCACSFKKKLSNDGFTCEDQILYPHIAIATGNGLYDLEHKIIGKSNISNITAARVSHVTYDPYTDSIIAADQVRSIIFSLHRDSQNMTIIRKFNRQEWIYGISFDYVGRNLYWSQTHLNSIMIRSLNTEAEVLLKFEDQPQDLVVVPTEGVMFVVFYNQQEDKYHIDRFLMDGTHRTTIIKENIKGPTVSLAYDRDLNRIYWADEGTGRIENFKIDGTDRHLFISSLHQPVTISVVQNFIFWSRRNVPKVFWADKSGIIPGLKHHIVQNAEDFNTFRMVPLSKIPNNIKHPCMNENGGCSHVCLLIVNNQRACKCPEGLKLDADHKTCKPSLNCPAGETWCPFHNSCIKSHERCSENLSNCTSSQFQCSNGNCIMITQLCDGYQNCNDGSDETQCCKFNEFRCDDGICIPLQAVCDKKHDCLDQSDEANCTTQTCTRAHFQCLSGKCIPQGWRCDRQDDCGDNSDEEGCMKKGCHPEQFKCKNRKCLDNDLYCDGIDDCGDGSDEMYCVKENSTLDIACKPHEYLCQSTSFCIDKHKKCDGLPDCPKSDDELNCETCLRHEFTCENQKCIPLSWICDKTDDCGDNSDEDDCGIIEDVEPDSCTTFQCDDGTCISYTKVCNNVIDCADGSDEIGLCATACQNNTCQNICYRTPKGPVCGCQDGYYLTEDNTTCADIDECALKKCPQLCRNTNGSFVCTCFEGYSLRSDMISCKADGEQEKIIITTDDEVRIADPSLNTLTTFYPELKSEITGLDVNSERQIIYLSYETLGSIKRINITSRKVTEVTGIGSPTVLAVDWITDNVYFYDQSNSSSIKVCHLDEKKCTKLIDVVDTKVQAMVVHPLKGWVFWSQTDWSHNTLASSEIHRIEMTGLQPTAIVTDNLGIVSAIAIDYPRETLYWTDSSSHKIEKSNFHGNNRKSYMSSHVYQPVGLNIFEDFIYWMSASCSTIEKCSIHDGYKRCNTKYLNDTSTDRLFVIMQESRQIPAKNPCFNHTCKHICTLTSTGSVCICGPGQIENSANTCEYNKGMLLSFHQHDLKESSFAEKHGLLLLGSIIIVTIFATAVYTFTYHKCRRECKRHIKLECERAGILYSSTNDMQQAGSSSHYHFSNDVDNPMPGSSRGTTTLEMHFQPKRLTNNSDDSD